MQLERNFPISKGREGLKQRGRDMREMGKKAKKKRR